MAFSIEIFYGPVTAPFSLGTASTIGDENKEVMARFFQDSQN
jgi:hypothetical protein